MICVVLPPLGQCENRCESTDCLLVQVEELQQVPDRQVARHLLLCLLLTVILVVVSKQPPVNSKVSLTGFIIIFRASRNKLETAELYNFMWTVMRDVSKFEHFCASTTCCRQILLDARFCHWSHKIILTYIVKMMCGMATSFMSVM